jgi:hypothetical protein
VQRGDRRLHHVRAPAAERQGPFEHLSALGDLAGVPQRPVLVAEEHDRPVGDAGVAAGIGEQHQRE